MRCTALAILLALAPCLAAAGDSQAIPERKVELPAEKGLVVGHQARQGRAILVELVPEGETVQSFKRMVSLQTMPDMPNVPEDALLRRFTELYRARCPRSTETPLGASGVRIDCPLHPATKRMETVFARALDLGRDRAIVHITMTFLPMPEDSRWAREYLARVVVR